jgi:hypothetical protein
MRYRKQDENGDPIKGKGRAGFYVDTDAVAQAILTKLRLFTGEWFENIYDGTPDWTLILGKVGQPKEVIDRIIQERIAETTGVNNVTMVYSNITNRSYSMTCSVDTVYGDLTITNNQGNI